MPQKLRGAGLASPTNSTEGPGQAESVRAAAVRQTDEWLYRINKDDAALC